MGQTTWSQYDHTKEPTSFTAPHADFTAANIDAVQTAILNMQTALDGVSLGNTYRRTEQAKSSPLAAASAATNELAQREAKAMMLYHDSITFETGHCEVPVIDLSLQMANFPGVFYDARFAGDEEAAWGTFVTAVQALFVGAGGNSVVVDLIYHIGKNN